MEPNYSPTLFFITLFTVITAFAIIMAWLHMKDIDRHDRKAAEQMKADRDRYFETLARRRARKT